MDYEFVVNVLTFVFILKLGKIKLCGYIWLYVDNMLIFKLNLNVVKIDY